MVISRGTAPSSTALMNPSAAPRHDRAAAGAPSGVRGAGMVGQFVDDLEGLGRQAGGPGRVAHGRPPRTSSRAMPSESSLPEARKAASPRHGLPARLVALAAAPSAAIPHQPLPATSRIPDMSACFRSQGRHSSESGADVLHQRQLARATRPVGRAVSRPGLVRLVGSAGGSRRDVPGGGRAEVMNASPDHP